MLRAIRDVDSSCGIILVTGRLDAEATTEALRHGALDCLARPLNVDRLRDSLTTVAAGIERRETLLTHDARAARQFEFQGIVGRSAAMQELFDGLRRFASARSRGCSSPANQERARSSRRVRSTLSDPGGSGAS